MEQVNPKATRVSTRKGIAPGAIVASVAFIALVAVLVALTLQAIEADRAEKGTIPNVPHNLVDASLVRLVTGEEALAELEQLHGKGLGLKGGYIAHYNGGKSGATLWVGEARNVGEAQRLTEAMTEKIKGGNAYFTNLRTGETGGNFYYSLDGADGLKHYYYQQQHKVIWVGVKASRPEEMLQAVMKMAW